ncbi:MAG: arsenate reductase/protein-tyrosine-phosphatase family protein [Candidatus Helarchaeota archaeon]
MDELLAQLRQKDKIVVLFLCSGNIVRSPMAEMLLELELKKRFGPTRIKAISGATTYFNQVIMDITKDLLIQEGVPPERILQFYPRNVKQYPELLEEADLIIGMEKTHIRLIPKKYRSKATTLSLLATGKEHNIPDPWGDEIQAYHQVFEVIKDYIKQLVDKFVEWKLIP